MAVNNPGPSGEDAGFAGQLRDVGSSYAALGCGRDAGLDVTDPHHGRTLLQRARIAKREG